MKKESGMDFTTGSEFRLLIQFMLPFLLASILNSLYNTVDMIVIGQFAGNEGTVAVSLGGKTLDVFTTIGMGFASGGQILISQLVGAGKKKELNSTIGTMMIQELVLAVFFSAVCLIFSVNILNLLNTPEETFAAALSYLRITAVGLPLMFGYNAVCNVLRGMGDSKSPLIFIAIASVINLILDIVFIVYFGLGATGTALATVIGQGAAFLFSVGLLYIKQEQYGFDFCVSSFRVDKEKLRIMTRLGVSLAAHGICITATKLFVTGYVNTFGIVQAAAYGIGEKYVNFANVVTMAVRQAEGSMIGQNIGAKKYDRVKRILYDSLIITMGMALLISAVSLLAPRIVFGIFTVDEQVLAYSPQFVRVCALIFIFSALLCMESVITGTGNATLSLWCGVLDGMVCRILFGLFFGLYMHMEAVGFFLGDALARLAPITISSIYYFRGSWMKAEVLIEEKH